MITVNVEQNTPEWLALKAGVPSASNFDKIVQANGKPSKQREKYLWRLAGERIAGKCEETYQNQAMVRGIEMEEEAVNLYELIRDVKTEKVGVCYPDEKKSCLCSPDRLIQGDSGGLLEIKCPITIHTHVGRLLEDGMRKEFFQQAQGQMYVTGLKWDDVMSYYPGIKPLIVRVERDEIFISALDFELKLFCAELDRIVEKIK